MMINEIMVKNAAVSIASIISNMFISPTPSPAAMNIAAPCHAASAVPRRVLWRNPGKPTIPNLVQLWALTG
jgi:hypothetical protein